MRSRHIYEMSPTRQRRLTARAPLSCRDSWTVTSYTKAIISRSSIHIRLIAFALATAMLAFVVVFKARLPSPRPPVPLPAAPLAGPCGILSSLASADSPLHSSRAADRVAAVSRAGSTSLHA